MRQRLCQLLSLVMAGVFPVASIAESPTAVVHTRGSVVINGKTPGESSNLFNGDKIQTNGSSSAASILVKGMHLMVMGDSNVTYADDSLTVHCGGVLVSTQGQVERINGITFTPSPSGASVEYEFRQSRGHYQIVSQDGSVAYDDGTGAKVLGVNQSATSAGGGEACNREIAAADLQNPAPVQGGMNVGGGGLSNGAAWALGGGSVFAAVCAVECRGHHHHKSPKNP